MKKFRFLSAFLAIFFSVSAIAQNITVKGSIKDAATGEPIPYAVVQIKGTSNGVMSDLNGEFTVKAPSKSTLVVSSIGYDACEVAATTAKLLVELEVDSKTLEEAVIVGYGANRKVGNKVGVISTVKSDIVKNAPSNSALDLLQGQVAGLSVLSTGGVAGDNNISMKIHGTGSLSSSGEPLFIIDGVQSSSSAAMMMNPNDILTVSVLKDASSTSIYGAQGANGVVFITTKSGSYDSRATVKVTSNAGISTLANKTFFENMMNSAELKNFWMRSGLMTADQITANYTSLGYDADTRWYMVMQRFNNPQYQNDITIEGGGSKVAYLVGASQFHQTGNTYGNYFDRYTLRSNVQARPANWLKVGVNLNGSVTQDQSNNNWGSSSGGANYTQGGLSYLLNPLYPAYDENGEMFKIKFPNGNYNPRYYNEDCYRNDYTTFRLLGNVFVEIEPYKNLIIRSSLGTDSTFEVMDRFALPSADFMSGSGMVQKSTYMASKNTLTNTIQYSRDFGGKHSFSVLAGHEGIGYKYKSWLSFSTGQTDDRRLTLQDGEAAKMEVQESQTEYKFLSFFGHADYSYAGRYTVDLTVRNDASSRFGAAKRNGLFWAAGLMWDAKKENFLRNVSWLNALNLKLSYGTQGNASIGNYSSLPLISSGSKYKDVTSMLVSQPANPDLGWEKQGLLTVSAAASFLDRIDLEVAFYDRTTTDMLMSVPYPYTSGHPSAYKNVGGLKNTGMDISLNLNILRGRDYTLDVRGTFNRNWERVTELFNGLDHWIIDGTGVAYVVGKPVMYYMPIYAGLSEQGMPQWYLPGEDTSVTTMDPARVTTTYDENKLIQNTGIQRSEPIVGGFGISGSWKGIMLRADFSFVLGKYLINNDMYYFANPNVFPGDNQSRTVSDFWTPQNTNAKWPDWSKGAKMEIDSHTLENASFLRFKTLVVGYSFPHKWFNENTVVKGLTITCTGRNLFTVTDYTGMDPEVDSNVTLGIPGNTLQILGGLEIKF